MNKIVMIIALALVFSVNANAWVTITDSGEVVRVTDWCGWGKTYYDKNWYLEQQIK